VKRREIIKRHRFLCLWVGVEVCFETRKRRNFKEFWRGREILAKFQAKIHLEG
jgi:hypothetical protein